jgi:hypothetical protein
MRYKNLVALWLAASVLFSACSRKTVPETTGKPVVTYNGKVMTNTSNNTSSAAKTTSRRIMVKRTALSNTPNVIMVNDKAAKRNIDGRLYYDLNGHRYWRNYDDGKYYLFSQAMYNNPAFKPH